MGSVMAFDIEGWIGLGKTELLGEKKGFFKFEVLGKHFGQDKVRGSVDDAFDGMQQVVIVVFLQVTDDGDGGAGCGFVEKGHTGLLLEGEQFGQVFGDHFFGGADDGFPVLECGRDDFEAGIGVVDHLDDGIDLRIEKKLIAVSGKEIGRRFPLFFRIADADPEDRRVKGLGFGKYLIDAFADYAEAKETDGKLLMGGHGRMF